MAEHTEKFPQTPESGDNITPAEDAFWDDDEFATDDGEAISLSEKYDSGKEGTFFSRHKKIIIPLIVLVLLAATLGIGSTIYTAFSPKETVASTDYRTVSKRDVIDRVKVKGTIEPYRTATLTTRLTTPVQELPVRVGDRVQANQLLSLIHI